MLVDNFHQSPRGEYFVYGEHYSSLDSCWDKAFAAIGMESLFTEENVPEVIQAVAADSSISSSSHIGIPKLDGSSTNPLQALSQCVSFWNLA